LGYPTWDVLVAGAGPAGATTARILASRGLRVIVADRFDRPSSRLEVASPSLRPLLSALGLLDLLDDSTIARPCLGIRRRWGGSPAEIEDFLAYRGGEGHVIDRAPFDAALRARARAAGARFIAVRVSKVTEQGGTLHASLSDGSALKAARVVDATGRAAAVARRLGAKRICSERLTARLKEQIPDPTGQAPGWLEVYGESRCWRYAIQGPRERRQSWSVSPVTAGGRGCEDASSARLDRAAGKNWTAVGDAAAAFDPITSQGLANAFSTAGVAAGMILAEPGGDAAEIYSDAVAATYEQSERARGEVYSSLSPT
jgi:flavin-dependent dehydrogenase